MGFLPSVRAQTMIAALYTSQTIQCIQAKEPTIPATTRNYCIAISATVTVDDTETVANGDFYAIVLRAWAMNSTYDDAKVCLYNAGIIIQGSPLGLMQIQPQTGYISSSTTVSLSYSYVGVSMTLPTQTIGFSESDSSSTISARWEDRQFLSLYGCAIPGTYAEQGVVVAVAEGTGFALSFFFDVNPYGQTNNSWTVWVSQVPTGYSSSGTLTIPSGHRDPPSYPWVGGGGGCWHCWRL